jgi:DGQHR domain-containing protein
MSDSHKKNIMNVAVIRGSVLGVSVYRGYAKLSDLARISKPDIYDQRNNPQGTQRDLSPKHAKEAYEYVKQRELAFWPEVFLSVRSKNVIKYKPLNANAEYGTLTIDLSDVDTKENIAIARVDGNHRLHYADGKDKKFPAIEKLVSFCLAYDITNEEETILFKDINDNQKPMNTSHLDNIEVRLTSKTTLKRKNPDLYIAQKMGRDKTSPLFDRIFEGGRKLQGHDIPLRSLRSGIKYLLSRSNQLGPLGDVDAQYKVIRNFFHSVKKWQPKAWHDSKNYLMLRGAGLWALCFIGSVVIDKTLLQSEYSSNYMLQILRSGKSWDWANGGPFKGLGGRGGAVEISNLVTKDFKDGSKLSARELLTRIMKEE